MPSILDLLRDPATLTVFALFAALAVWERITPGRALPQVRGWNARALLAFVLFLAVSIYLPLLLADWIAPLHLFDLSAWPTVGAAALGVLVYEFGAYAYHRSLHSFTPLWRAVYQMHHSAERLDVPGAFWFGPLDMIGWSLLPALALTLLGLAPTAATAAALFITFLGIFQHANLRTPRWLGYFIQRPESHSVHHQRGVHRHNYADLPLIDMLFGTFRNPREHARDTGFWHGASARLIDLLLARDISRAPR